MIANVESSDAFGWRYSGDWPGPIPGPTLSGTASISGRALTGVGTLLTSEVVERSYIVLDDFAYRIEKILNDTQAEVDIPRDAASGSFFALEDEDAKKWRDKKATLERAENEILACVPAIEQYPTTAQDIITQYAVRLWEGWRPREDMTVQSMRVGDMQESYRDEKSCLDRFPKEIQVRLEQFAVLSFGSEIERECQE